ncbi:MAG: hypothetical protein FWF03_05315, partial [Defluviitaleaceae bacterium]|nr:hypothetical protein [Defluviitaleaceae bacterium]
MTVIPAGPPFVQIDKSGAGGFAENYLFVACRLRNSRSEAKRAAVSEVFMALYPFGALFVPNGPLCDTKNFICFMTAST